jgi:formylglycine-generating enzyme required for sulfatase activity
LLEPNAYGLYDMSGNVWEWCADDYDHPGAHRSRAKLRSRRGGSWGNDPSYCQIKHRSHRAPSRRYDDLGLRLCRLAQM